MQNELFKDEMLTTIAGWNYVLKSYGHAGFSLDGMRYFVFPMGPHAYGMCLAEDMETGNHPRWQFSSEQEFLSAPLFNGRSIGDRLDEVMAYEP